MAKASRALLQARGTIEELRAKVEAMTLGLANRNTELANVVSEGARHVAEHRDALRRVAELEAQNAEIGQQLVDQGARLKRLDADLDVARTALNEARKAAHDAEADNNFLRDSMHNLTINCARLEGKLERVREFDPVTDQQRHRDGTLAIADRIHNSDGYAQPIAPARTWYRRG